MENVAWPHGDGLESASSAEDIGFANLGAEYAGDPKLLVVGRALMA
jgi:hypothetical protein